MSEYRALYRKWRPNDFDAVCGQSGITDILKHEVKNNKLSHAYLFCGSRGTGKTSCAKILAKAVNCESPINGNPCNACASCRSVNSGISTDVIEMDAASNNGIDTVRDMQDELAFTPAELKYRVYIIDEVHMMSGQAFNALLKTLEEPPAYVIFILATTEHNKLPTTIVSRCQRFDFKRIESNFIIERLLHISANEGIEITEDAARIIARASRGGMRDAISLLELCAGAHVKIDEQLVFDTIGAGNRDSAYKLIYSIGKSDNNAVYSIVDDLVMKSGDISVFWQELIDAYRDVMVVKNTDRAKSYLDLTDAEYQSLTRIAADFSMSKLSYHVSLLEGAMSDMQRAFNSKRSIAEIALTRMCDPRLTASYDALLERVESLERELGMIKLGVTPLPGAYNQATAPEVVVEAPTVKASPTDIKASNGDKQAEEAHVYASWGDVVERITGLKPSLAVGLSSARVLKTPDNRFSISLSDFFTKKLAESRTDLALLRGAIAEAEDITPDRVTIVLAGKVVAENDDLLAEIENALN